jgi:glycosyltransferase involved in cell wall biosynthesis
VPVVAGPPRRDPVVERATTISVVRLDDGDDVAAKQVTAAAALVDVVHVLRLYLVPFVAPLLEQSPRPKLVLDVDDVESMTRRRMGDVDEAARFERLEARYLPLFDRVVACSDADAALLAERYALSDVSVVPNAVRQPVAVDSAVPAHDLLFVGNLSYGPNVEAARWLCMEVLPLLGDTTVALVGSQPAAPVRALAADPRVTVAADVDDITPWYAASRIAVAPLQAGGGTRTKIAEAFVHQRPVVATPVGAEGWGWDGEDGPVVSAASPADFARACRRLLDDPPLAASLAGAGADVAMRTATVDAVAPAIDDLVRRTLVR